MNVAPVRLIRAQNDQHKSHKGTKLARATINSLEEIAGILGPKQVTFHSQDDKTKVSLGLPAAKKQAPILMHMEFQIRLPGHDFVVAPMHKLIPSVIADMQIKERRCREKPWDIRVLHMLQFGVRSIVGQVRIIISRT